MIKKNTILKLLFILLSLSVALFSCTFTTLEFLYKYDISTYIYILLIALLIYLLNKTLKLFGVEEDNRAVLVVALLFLIFFLARVSFLILGQEEIDEHGGVVATFVISEKTNVPKSTLKEIKSYRMEGERRIVDTFRVSPEEAELFSIGDTLLAVYALRNTRIAFTYKEKPSSAEIQRFKDGVYYLDGKLIDSVDVRTMLEKYSIIEPSE